MSVKINLKHSSTKDKAPVPADLSSAGEIALNLHPDSPALYIKDADGDIVKLAGAGSITDSLSVKKAGDNMTGDLTLGTDKITLDATTGSGEFTKSITVDNVDTDATLWLKNKGTGAGSYGVINFGETEGAGSITYNDRANNMMLFDVNSREIVRMQDFDGSGDLRVGIKTASMRSTLDVAGGITSDGLIDSKGGINSDELVESDGGVKVTGGTPSEVVSGIGSNGYNDQRLYTFADGKSIAQFAFDGTTVLGFDGVAENKDPLSLRSDTVASVAGGSNLISFQGRNSVNTYSAFGKFGTVLQEDAGAGGGRAKFSFELDSGGGIQEKTYVGNLENFTVNDTYIGGTTARNTFELWKSTLTKDQLETLEAGTLVAPANVSLPGDGEFARQWWYDQQDAETQAELDAGTLDYPEHLLAANFIDNFALGDNTEINLLSNGRGEFAGGVKVSGGTDAGVGEGLRKQGASVRIVNNSVDMVNVSTTQSSFNGRVVVGNQGLDLTSGNGLLVKNDLNFASGDGSLLMVNPETISGTYNKLSLITARTKSTTAFKCQEYVAVEILQPIAASNMTKQDGTSTDLIGIKSAINGGANYNIYATGTAPNYFAGLVESEGGVKVSGGTGASVEIGLYYTSDRLTAATTSSGADSAGLHVVHIGDGQDSTVCSGLSVAKGSSNGSLRPDFRGVYVRNMQTNVAGEKSYGVYSETATGSPGSDNYNFYAAGNAPNYFAGFTYINSNEATLLNGWTAGDAIHDGMVVAGSMTQVTKTNAPCAHYLRASRNNDISESRGTVIQFYKGVTDALSNNGVSGGVSLAGTIEMSASGDISPTSLFDARLIESEGDITNATTLVKQLAPKRISRNGIETFGFNGTALKAAVSEAVFGEVDATQAIGTLADYDGTVLETAVGEPSAEELTYTEEVETDGVTTQEVRTKTWSPTGTRPVYQGVDQTKLIPLLTKALQEALERIEVLEAALS